MTYDFLSAFWFATGAAMATFGVAVCMVSDQDDRRMIMIAAFPLFAAAVILGWWMV